MYEIDIVGICFTKFITSSHQSFSCKDKMNENDLTKLDFLSIIHMNDSCYKTSNEMRFCALEPSIY